MKYYSEITKKIYDNESDLHTAEKETKELEEKSRKELEEKKQRVQKLQEQRNTRAKEVEDAYRVADTAQKEADNLLKRFLGDYGSFHSTQREVKPKFSFLDFFDFFR